MKKFFKPTDKSKEKIKKLQKKKEPSEKNRKKKKLLKLTKKSDAFYFRKSKNKYFILFKILI